MHRHQSAFLQQATTEPLFEHGIWFTDLAGLGDPLAVPQTVAKVLIVPEAHDRPLIESVTDFLQHKRCLLILDNCEHLLSACAELAQTLLDADAHLHILATSREPLDLAGEIVWLVPSLAVPDAYPPSQFKHLAKSEAIQLCVARAGVVLPGFTLDETNASAVAQICRRLDGIPLAIELAAARVKMMSVEEICSRLDDRFGLLTSGSRAALPRHQTLRAAIDWSYDLLNESEQILFRRGAVFAYGFTLAGAEAVCGSLDLKRGEILNLLGRLVDKSLVIAGQSPASTTRYNMATLSVPSDIRDFE